MTRRVSVQSVYFSSYYRLEILGWFAGNSFYYDTFEVSVQYTLFETINIGSLQRNGVFYFEVSSSSANTVSIT